MDKCICVKKHRNNSNKIVGYTLKDAHGKRIYLSAGDLKTSIRENRIEVMNLSLTADNRLIGIEKRKEKRVSRKKKVKIAISGLELLVNDENVVKFNSGFRPGGEYSAFVRCDTCIKNDTYFAIIVHDCNVGCYKYLDSIYIVDLENGEVRDVPYYEFVDRSMNSKQFSPDKLSFSNDGKNRIIVYNEFGPAMVIKTDVIFAKPLVNGDTVSPKLDMNNPYTWFNFKVVENDDIVMTLKDKVGVHNLLKLPGFSSKYNAFKFSGAVVGYGQSSLHFFNTNSNDLGWTMEYGPSTTLVSDNIWKVHNRLIDILMNTVPNYKKIQNIASIQLIS